MLKYRRSERIMRLTKKAKMNHKFKKRCQGLLLIVSLSVGQGVWAYEENLKPEILQKSKNEWILKWELKGGWAVYPEKIEIIGGVRDSRKRSSEPLAVWGERVKVDNKPVRVRYQGCKLNEWCALPQEELWDGVGWNKNKDKR